MGNRLSEPHSIFPGLPSFQSLHIVILGLDCAGKTTVLYRLRFNEFVNTVPTKGFNTEKIKLVLGTKSRTAAFHFWDVGGQEKLRPLWRSYTRCADGLVFVVDSVDAERMEEAKTELHKITRLQENQGVPVLREKCAVSATRSTKGCHHLGSTHLLLSWRAQMFTRVNQQDSSSQQDSTTRSGLIITSDWHEDTRLSNLSAQSTIYPEKACKSSESHGTTEHNI
ncbi:ADP-ribosylation factor-like protein 4A [Clarias magur]|uniref:ADP-ribosylation factor-like protein 4A n=1 Tax=Clarias magur TaxID=1594786 RepID=A0A8J4XAV1_CLAMG|nr:ADP-ribosylation factor-like protein 4A [Clarias magur]